MEKIISPDTCICFAYYGDGKFLGWYSDSFGTITKNRPKIYNCTPYQIGVIKNNFFNKVRKVKNLQEDDFKSVTQKIVEKFNPLAAELLKEPKSILADYSSIELRIVECPFYDGPNPDFNSEEYKKLSSEKLQNQDIVLPKSWISADRSKVEEWALNEPNEFLDIIMFEI